MFSEHCFHCSKLSFFDPGGECGIEGRSRILKTDRPRIMCYTLSVKMCIKNEFHADV